jgi:transposase
MKYIGMDAHSKTCFFVVLNKAGKVLMRKRVDTSETNILEFVQSVQGEKKLAYEEGVLSQWLYLLLKDQVVELVVCQPREHGGPKTDELDAGELADLLRVGRLKSVFHADNELMNLRALVSGQGDLIRVLGQEKNRFKALFRQVAITTNGSKIYHSKEMISQLPTDTQRYVATTLYEQIELLEMQRQGYLDLFELNAKKYTAIKLLMSIPGIGPIRANQIAAIVVTPFRFCDKYHLFSYAKLTQHTRESDGRQYGKSRANGNPLLKVVFRSAVLGAMKSNTAFRRKYDEMRVAGVNDRASRNAVAKMIAATVLAVWKTGKAYNDHYKEETQRRNQICHSEP